MDPLDLFNKEELGTEEVESIVTSNKQLDQLFVITPKEIAH